MNRLALVRLLSPLYRAQRKTGTVDNRRLALDPLESRENPAPVAAIQGLASGSILLGDTASYGFTFANTGSTAGFGPFVEVAVDTSGPDGATGGAPDGYSAPTVTAAGLTLTAAKAVTLAAGQTTFTNPLTNESRPVPAGFGANDTIYVYALPFGSFTPGQTTAATITANTSNLADVGTPLPIAVTGGFRDDSPALDGPGLYGAEADASVTPDLYRFKKIYLGPEDETATGPNFVRRYRLEVDVATGQTLNNLHLIDDLPPSMQIVGKTATNMGAYLNGSATNTFNAANLTGTAVTTAPDGTLDYNFGAVTGTASTADAAFEFDFYVPRDNAGGATQVVPQTGTTGTDSTTNQNTGRTAATWTPLDPRDAAQNVGKAAPDNGPHTLEQQSIAVQKVVEAVDPTTGAVIPAGQPIRPGQTLLRYTVNFQVSDYYAFDDVFVNDVLSDGQRLFVGTTAGVNAFPTLTVNNAYLTGATTGSRTNTTGNFQGSQVIAYQRRYTAGDPDSDPQGYAADGPALGAVSPGVFRNQPAAPDTNVNTGGTALVQFNVSDELRARLGAAAGRLVGGDIGNDGGGPFNHAVGSQLFGGTTGTIVFYALVTKEFSDAYPSGDKSVDQGDVLTNTVNDPLTPQRDGIVGTQLRPADVNAATPTAIGTGTDDSGTSVAIPYGVQEKQIYAINGQLVPAAGPTDPPLSLQPGDAVTYRLTYTLPISSFENLRLIDFAPLPVMPVAGSYTFVRDPAAYTFAPGTVGVLDAVGANATDDTYFATFDAAQAGGRNPTIAADPTANSLTMNFGSQDDTLRRSTQISLLVTFVVGNQPFASDLFLTNQLRVAEGSTNAGSTTVEDLRRFELVRPMITVQKGTAAAGTTGFTVGSGADQITFGGTNVALPAMGSNVADTVVNRAGTALSGTNAIYNAAEAAAVGGQNITPASPVDSGDTVRYAVVVQNTDKGDAFDVHLTDTIQPQYDRTAFDPNANLRVIRGDGTVLTAGTDYTITYTAATGQIGIDFTDNYTAGNVGGAAEDNRAGALSRGNRTAGAITNGSNTVIILYDVTLLSTVTPNATITNTATVTTYSNAEGGQDLTDPAVIPGATDPADTATVVTRLPLVAKALVGTGVTETGNNAADQATIGETATYAVTLTVPEGFTPGGQIVDTLDAGLAFVDVTGVAASAGLSFANGGLPTTGATPANTTISNGGRTITFTLGDITNGNTNNAVAETITITYRVVVLNVNGTPANNQAGQTRTNSALFSWTGNATALAAVGAGQGNTNTGGVTGAATPITLVEPTVTTAKDVRNFTAGGTFGQTTRGDAGDEIDYQITLTASGSVAHEVTLDDPLPTASFAGGFAVQSVVTAGTVRVNGSTSTPLATTDFVIDGAGHLRFKPTIDIDMDAGATITVVVRGTDFTGSTGQRVTNTAQAQWTSLDGTVSGERTGADGPLAGGALNDYQTSDDAVIESPAVVRKTIVATSEPSTAPATFAPNGQTTGVSAAVGEIVRYRVYVSVGETPAGTPTANVQIRDFIPNGLSFLNDGTARYAFISSNGANLTSSTLPNAGISGDESTLATLASGSIAGQFTDADISTSTSAQTGEGSVYADGQDVFFRFGDISNADRDTNAEYIVLEYNALVRNVAGNQAGTNLDNSATPLVNNAYVDVVNDANGDGLGTGEATIAVNPANPTNLPRATATVVEPNVQINKEVTATTGGVVTYRLTVTNPNAGNTTTAFNTRVLDILNATNFGLIGVTSVTLAGGATGATNNTAGNTVDVSIDSLPVGGSVVVTYTANVLVTPTGTASLDNTGQATTTTLPGPSGTGGAWTGTAATSSTVPGAAASATGERDGSGGVNDYLVQDTERLGSLGDRVYFDANGNGVQDAGEAGLVGVPVTVRWAGLDGAFNTGDDSVITATTGTDGQWTVTGLPLGATQQYQVSVPTSFSGMAVTDATDDGVLTPSAASSITLTGTTGPTTNNRAQDFGYRGTATLGDRVYVDANGDGAQAANGLEPSLPGVTVTLTWAGPDGNLATAGDNVTFTTVSTATTGTNPNYLLPFLPSGNFSIAVSTAPGTGGVPDNATFTDSIDNGGPPSPTGTLTVSLTTGQNLPVVDFGYKGAAGIGDTVWYDANNNGVQDAGEPGIAGATVTLLWSGPNGTLGDGDDVTFTTTTDANGHYLFPGLPVNGASDPYRVTVIAPAADPTQTFDADGTATASQSALNLGATETNLLQDFGYRGTASLGDFVWLDTNGNGKQDAGEGGISGVPVQLFFDHDGDGLFTSPGENLPLLTTTTGAGGAYAFANLAAGNYQVVFGASDGTIAYTRTVRDSTAANDATDSDADAATGRTGTYALANGASNQTVDEGLYVPLSIGDTVWFDANNNGAYDPATEPGVPNVKATVTWLGVDGVVSGDDQSFTATTDSAGRYLVSNLPPGKYTVSVDPTTLPQGLVQTYDLDGVGTANTTNLVAVSGVNRLDADFGYRGTDGIGDTVFLDINNNGAYDAGEGIAGVTVTLAGDVDGDGQPETFTTTTDTNGQYLFPNLRVTAAGVSYTVTVNTATLPTGATPSFDPDGTLDGMASKTLTTTAATDLTRDFGYRAAGKIGDTIFLDANNNGAYDAGEGITGVTVTLTGDFDGDGQLETVSTVTDANGQYLFSGLVTNDGKGSGNGIPYTVAVTAGTLPAGVAQTVDPDATLDNSSPTALTDAAKIDLTRDFGYRGTAKVGDTVWYDANNDGVKTANEPGVSGVTVTVVWFGQNGLEGDADDVTTTATTGANGLWQVTGLPPGNYRATVTPATLPNDLSVQTYDLNGVGTPNTTPFPLALGENRTDVDFGYRGTASLGDFVWVDLNGDGKQDANEPGVPNATVTLTWYGPDGKPGSGDDATLTTVTDANGKYQFANLPSGTFQAAVDPATIPANLRPTFDLDGVGTANAAVTTLTTGQNRTDVDFGYQGTASVGDFVWYDVNADGTPTFAEPGIAGATVTLLFGGADGDLTTAADNITFVTTTGADGKYLLSGLPVSVGAGNNYRATVSTVPAVYTTQTFDLDGVGTANTAAFLLGPSENRRDVDFGFRGTASLGDYVFEDKNGNGVQDAGDPGVANLAVNLLDAAGNKLATTTTDGGGKYSFPGLAAGGYKVAFVTPAGYAITAKDQQANDAADSDADPTTGVTAAYALATGETNPTVDAGLYVPVSIGDTLYYDADGNGTQAPTNEPGIPNTTVTLTWYGPDGVPSADDKTFTTTTDATGTYLFTNLPPGNFKVHVSNLPNGLTIPTADLDGVATPSTTKLTTTSGVDRRDADFGYRGTGSLGDLVYYDFNGTGAQDAGEPGIAGATVNVTWLGFDGVAGGGDDVTYTTTTDATGLYAVGTLPLGNFVVSVDTTTLPSGFSPVTDLDGVATPNTTAITLTAGNPNRTDADFGYRGPAPASLGDRVWVDFNSDGKQDADEPGVPGATVVVDYAGVDGIFGTVDDGQFITKTGANGMYSFANLQAGTFKVSVTAGLPAGTVATYDLDGTADDATQTTLTFGQNRTDVDFGVRGTSSVSGSVFRDDSNDGHRDPGEPGYAGVTITLTGTDALGNSITRVTTTDANGDYTFGGLMPGTYTVTETTQPPETADGLDSNGNINGSPDGTAGNDVIQTITLGAGQASVANVFGELAGSVAGTVFVDLNRDGTLDPGEAPLPGETIQLLDSTGKVIRTTTTGPDGTYLIRGFPPGTYTVREVQPTGYASSSPNDLTVNVPPLGLTDLNFAEVTGRVAGYVYRDLSVDGVRGNAAGETGIGGTTITLTGTDVRGNAITRTLTTATDGSYRFDGLLQGNYRVTETQPTGFYYDGLDTPGSLGGTTPANDVLALALTPGTIATDYNFGECPPADPFGYVYVDANRNGVKDPGEPGIAGVPITISGTAFAGTVLAHPLTAADVPGGLTVFTNGAGRWEFPLMPPGVYSVVEATQPAGYLDGYEHNDDPNGPAPTVGNDRFDNVSLMPAPIRGPFDFGEWTADATKSEFLGSTPGAAAPTGTRANVPLSPSFGVTTGTPTVPAFVATATGAGASPEVRVFDYATGGERLRFLAYENTFTGGVRVATGDVNGDGVPDIVTGIGVGGGPRVRVFSGVDATPIYDNFVYEPTFTGGLFVALGDINGDGRVDLVTGTDSGGGPRVRAIDLQTGATLADFFAFDLTQRGGVRIAVADIDGDGRADIVATAGAGVETQIKVFSGGNPNAVIRLITPYSATFTGGVYVATGDVNGDGVPDIVSSADAGGGPHVQVFDFKTGGVLQSFFAYEPTFTGGVRVATQDVNGDGKADIVAVPGAGGAARVRIFSGADLSSLDDFYATDPAFVGGVYVG